MIEGAIWRKWVFFYVPMGLFLLFLLFPFYWMVITSVRPDGELYRPWNSINYNPFWTWKPTWDHIPVRGDAVCVVAVEHDVHRARVNRYLARVWRVRRLCSVAAELSICRQ